MGQGHYMEQAEEPVKVEGATAVWHDLKDRAERRIHIPAYLCTGQGQVVIRVTVDAEGRVRRAEADASRSTTTDGCMVEHALSSAQEARFARGRGPTRKVPSTTCSCPSSDNLSPSPRPLVPYWHISMFGIQFVGGGGTNDDNHHEHREIPSDRLADEPVQRLREQLLREDISQIPGSDEVRRQMPGVNIVERDSEFDLQLLAPGSARRT